MEFMSAGLEKTLENRLCELTTAAIVQSQGAGIGLLHNQDSVQDCGGNKRACWHYGRRGKDKGGGEIPFLAITAFS